MLSTFNIDLIFSMIQAIPDRSDLVHIRTIITANSCQTALFAFG